MKAIRTKYIGPSSVKGSRISASDGDGNRIIIGYKSELSSDENHAQAALALCAKLGWHGTLIEGSMVERGVCNGKFYVWDKGAARIHA